MSKPQMKLVAPILWLFAGLALVACPQKGASVGDPSARVGVVSAITGVVTVTRGAAPAAVPVAKGLIVARDMTFETAAGATLEVTFDNNYVWTLSGGRTRSVASLRVVDLPKATSAQRVDDALAGVEADRTVAAGREGEQSAAEGADTVERAAPGAAAEPRAGATAPERDKPMDPEVPHMVLEEGGEADPAPRPAAAPKRAAKGGAGDEQAARAAREEAARAAEERERAMAERERAMAEREAAERQAQERAAEEEARRRAAMEREQETMRPPAPPPPPPGGGGASGGGSVGGGGSGDGTRRAGDPPPPPCGPEVVEKPVPALGKRLVATCKAPAATKLSLTIVVDGARGRASKVTIDGETDDATEACVQRVVRSQPFPKCTGDAVKLVVPVELVAAPPK